MKIRKIEGTNATKVKRVAAYARVSTLLEEQEDSYDTQVNYYTNYIRSVSQWSFVKVYTDRGRSGSKADSRPGFMEMMDDADGGKIDLILVKSISRFARNAIDAQDYIHALKTKNVEVRFDREGISSFDPAAEMVFSLMASMAQEEIHSISDKVKWTNRRLLERGIHHIGSRHVLGYDEIDGKLIPNEDAWIIKQAFEAYAAGKSITQIADELNAAGAETLYRKGKFTEAHVSNMLKTVIYVGDRHLQQAPPKNYLTHKPDPSQAYTGKYIRNDHEGIVSRELWDKVRNRCEEEKEMRAAGIHKRSSTHFLYGKIFCAECGMPYQRKTVKSSGGMNKKVWKCHGAISGSPETRCDNRPVDEDRILESIKQKLGISIVSEKDCETVKRIEISGDGHISIKVLRAA